MIILLISEKRCSTTDKGRKLKTTCVGKFIKKHFSSFHELFNFIVVTLLKVLYHKLGIENGGRKISFLFTDSHVAEEGFLELINNMLTTGAVPALFADDEKDGIINNMRDEAGKAGYPPGKESIWSYFINKCADNLHIILARGRHFWLGFSRRLEI